MIKFIMQVDFFPFLIAIKVEKELDNKFSD